jgi:hypothetical protein
MCGPRYRSEDRSPKEEHYKGNPPNHALMERCNQDNGNGAPPKYRQQSQANLSWSGERLFPEVSPETRLVIDGVGKHDVTLPIPDIP